MRGLRDERSPGEGFCPGPALAPFVRYVYCHECGNVSTNIWVERNVCTSCGHAAERMALGRPWQSYVSSAILLIATGVLIFGPIMDPLQRTVLVIAALVVAFALSSWSLKVSKER
ncbi:MAG: hypothetical protein WDA71_13125, partial [Actinomycetota bacterium]